MLFGDEHVRRYEETNGEVGHDWEMGAPVLILTTKGRKTGKDRKFPLIYQEHKGDYVIVASNAGFPNHPGWYLNLQADPAVRVQIKDDKFSARARATGDAERAALWPTMVAVWPDYDEYQKKTDRRIPLLVLERT